MKSKKRRTFNIVHIVAFTHEIPFRVHTPPPGGEIPNPLPFLVWRQKEAAPLLYSPILDPPPSEIIARREGLTDCTKP